MFSGKRRKIFANDVLNSHVYVLDLKNTEDAGAPLVSATVSRQCRDTDAADCIAAVPLKSISSNCVLKVESRGLIGGCNVSDVENDSNVPKQDEILTKLDELLSQANECLGVLPEKCNLESSSVIDLDEKVLPMQGELENESFLMVEKVEGFGGENRLDDIEGEDFYAFKDPHVNHTNCTDDAANAERDHKYNKFVNFIISQHDGIDRVKVRKLLSLFDEKYKELTQGIKANSREGKSRKQFHFLAAEFVKSQGMWIHVQKPFGHIPGVEIGDVFQFRLQLVVVGIHRQSVCGIDYVVFEGKKYATSIVNSGRYANQAKSSDVLIYSGQGGNSKFVDKVKDQKLEKGNIAMVNSLKMRYPVRVTHKIDTKSNKRIINEGNYVYVYDGLYTIHSYWQERDNVSGKLVFKFELHRIEGQARSLQVKPKKIRTGSTRYIVGDISKGKEIFSVRASNDVDEDRPLSFVYITKVVYPNWYTFVAPVGCGCIDGCSDSSSCACLMKNGGEIPYNEKANIIKAKPLVHECGPECKCPPSCLNRVSQRGPRYQLEIFKTKTRGWGVRSRSFISSGGFICEYIGELLRDEDAELRVGSDEYLFDISAKYALDAKDCGNIGRFINHSCSPNIYAQEVLYDHDDKRVPHIMFFATKNIPPLRELCYDYNYKKVYDKDGNAKMKSCLCGSSNCTGNMYCS